MKNKKWTAIFLSLILGLTCFSVTACDGNESVGPVKPIAGESKVTEVVLYYDGKEVNGVIDIDVSERTAQFTVQVFAGADEATEKKVVYTSNNSSVATIDENGLVTLVGIGEAAITVSCDDVVNTVVLNVEDAGTNVTYAVTVNGGTASATRAFAGDIVTLTSANPMHKTFEGWEFPETVEWINGNTFRMPSCDVVVNAEYSDVLYKLSVVGAKIGSANGVSDPIGTDGGNSKNGNLPQYEITDYEFVYGTELVLEPLELEGYSFVGIDRDSKNNRIYDVAADGYEFSMYGKDTTLTAVYSERKTVNMTSSNFNDSTKGYKKITAGVPTGEAEETAFNGFSGFRFALPENTTKGTKTLMSLTDVDSLNGRKSVRVVVKNNWTKEMELGFSFGKLSAQSESKTSVVQPGETAEYMFTLNITSGWNWVGSKKKMEENALSLCLNLAQDLGGSSMNTALLDVVVGVSDLYPDGDPYYETEGTAERVTLGASYIWYNWDSGFYRRPEYSEDMTKIQLYYAPSDFGTNGDGLYYANGISGAPTDRNLKLYMRVTNLNTVNETLGIGYRIVVSTDYARSNILAEKTVIIDEIGQQTVFVLDLVRPEDVNGLIISYQPVCTGSVGGGAYCDVVIETFYNNVIGVEE